MLERRRSMLVIVGGILVAVLLVSAIGVFGFLQRNVPETFSDPVEHFKYGSIGADSQDGGVPYAVWRVLPTVFPDKLPNRPGEGYARFGFVYETPAAPRPISTSI